MSILKCLISSVYLPLQACKIYPTISVMNSSLQISHFSTSSQCCVGKYKKNFLTNFGADNPLITGPDYSHSNGKEVPLNYKAMQRRKMQIKLSSDILRMLNELQDQKLTNKEQISAEEEYRQNEIESKFKLKSNIIISPSTGHTEVKIMRGKINKKAS